MNLFPNLKKKQTGHVAIPVGAPSSVLGDLTPLAQLVQPMRSRMKEFDHAIHALSVARERLRDLADLPPPDMTITVQREIAVAMGEPQVLERFDAENAVAIKAEREACDAAVRDRDVLPARIKALEEIVRRIAQKMISGDATTVIDREAKTVFAPYAQRVMEVAQQFADVMQEANTAASVLSQALVVYEYDLFGELKRIHRPELMGAVDDDGILPKTMAGVSWEDIQEINRRVKHSKPEVAQPMDQELVATDILGERLRMYAPCSQDDHRKISSPELTRRIKRPQPSPYGAATVITVSV